MELVGLGYDEPVEFFKDSSEEIFDMRTPNDAPCILWQKAFRWFREKHKLMFQIFYLRNGNHAALIHKTTPEYMDMVDQIRPSGCVEEVVDCYSYEEAELECLRKLIQIVKNK